MTLIASVLFLSAFAISVFAIWATGEDAMPRIKAVIAEEFEPALHDERRINFGEVKQFHVARSADVISLRPVLLEQQLKLAA